MNLRNAGSGFGRARGIYHAGRTEDLRAVLDWAISRSPGSPIALVGFSLGANLVLKLAGELDAHPIPQVDSVLAASPPVDLSACCKFLMRPTGRPYDRNLVNQLKKLVDRLHARFPELGAPDLAGVRSLYEFDDRYTAPRNGFLHAEDYYSRSSSAGFIPRIRIPGLVVHARDDPFIPPAPVASCAWPSQLDVEILNHGGHLGFVSQKPWAGDRRWLETRMTAWLCKRWSILQAPIAARQIA
jgi:predicted alpha/beta-fold hydrolase